MAAPVTRAKAPKVERRNIAVDDLETRAANDDGSIPFKGHAAVFNKRANIAGIFEEEFAPGAFAKTLREADVRMLINHDPSLVLARTKPGTLRLSENRRGLLNEADMAPTTYAQDLAISMRRGDVTQMSIMFVAVRENWDETRKIPLRTVQEARLFDTSVVTFPAYEATDASLRSQIANVYKALGIDDLDEGTRDALIVQASDGDVAREMVPVLHTIQARVADMLQRAGAISLADEGDEQGELPARAPVQVFQMRQRILELQARAI